jgi:hypothetical protein
MCPLLLAYPCCDEKCKRHETGGEAANDGEAGRLGNALSVPTSDGAT